MRGHSWVFLLPCLVMLAITHPRDLFSQAPKDTKSVKESPVTNEALDLALEKSKLEFQTKSADNLKKLASAIEQRVTTARKAGNRTTLERARADQEKFEADGTLPASLEKASQFFQSQSAAIRAKLELAYRNRIKEHVRRFEDAEAEALQKELDQFLASDPSVKNNELLRNGGCEDELAVVKDAPWIATVGKFERRTESPAPHAGAGYFWPSYNPESELVQDVDVKKFRFYEPFREFKRGKPDAVIEMEKSLYQTVDALTGSELR